MANNNQKKYASLTSLQTLVDNIKSLFVKKTDLSTELAKKADSSHTHTIANVTNLQTTLDGKVPTSRTVNGKTLTSNITLSASDVGAATSGHDHDDRYYTETEIDTKLSGKSDTTHNHDDKYDAKNTASSAVSTHNTSTTSHNDIRDLITGLTTRLNTLANSDDTTLDQMSEIVAYIENNKSLIDGITTNKVNVSDIVNNLTTNVINKPLSAAQGVEIKRLIDALQSELESIPQSDWNQNDSTKLDYIKNRPFYETDPVEMLIAEGAVPVGEYMQVSASVQFLTLGRKYKVVFDGITYDNLVCADAQGLPAVGSIDFSYTDYPFVFTVQSGTTMGLVGDNSVSHTMKVVEYVSEIIPLERKYIAEYIDTFAGEKVTGRTYTIDDSQVTAGEGAEVFNDYTYNIASGRQSHAEGHNTVASGSRSHAEGNSAKASGTASHAEGFHTEATKDYTHAEGYMSKAEEQYAHAEGYSATASGEASHAEGFATWASGEGAHTEGSYTTASGEYSHAEGFYTHAASKQQHVQGKYNIIDRDANDVPLNTYAHIVGNGTSNTKRSNAHTLDWDGNGWFAGNVLVGGTSQDDASKLISEADQKWNLIYDSGEISAIANSISNIDVSGYTNIQVLVRIYNDGDSINSRNGSAIFTCENGKTYQFPVWTNMFSKSINTVYTMATFKLVDGWLVCPCASRLIGDASTFDEEGGTAGNLVPTGSGVLKCTSPLSTLTVSSLDQNSNYYFGMGSRVMVWGWNA